MPEEDKSILRHLLVKLEYENGRAFDIPYSFVRNYKLRPGASIHCILIDLSNKNEQPKKIGDDVIIDIDDSPTSVYELRGRFQSSTVNLYDIGKYQYAYFKMKKSI
jgi:hypothetical protein